MASTWTLPLLQGRLDELPDGAEFTLTRDEMIDLFGRNNAAAGRIAHFAAGHSCAVYFTPQELLFRKKPAVKPRVAGGN